MPFDCKGDPRDQPAATQRNDHRVDFVQVIDDLQPDRSLARDDLPVVDRVNHSQTRFSFQAASKFGGFVLRSAPDAQFAAGRCQRLDLAFCHLLRNTNGYRNTELASDMGDGPSVVAGRVGNHATPLRILIQSENGIRSASHLEGTGILERFKLQGHRSAHAPGQVRRWQERRAARNPGDPLPRDLHFLRINPINLGHGPVFA